jgi:Erg28 like protein
VRGLNARGDTTGEASNRARRVHKCKQTLQRSTATLTRTIMIAGQDLLKYWLLFAAALRMLSVGVALFKPDLLKSKVYRLRPDWVNPMGGRVFASWTLVTCMLCVLCAFRMQEPTLYLATLGSFIVAFINFAAEFLVFQTVDFKGFMSPFIVSSISITWLIAGWGTYSAY